MYLYSKAMFTSLIPDSLVRCSYRCFHLFQRTPCPVDDIDLFLGNSLGAFSLSILNDDDSKLISSAHSDDGHTFVTPLPTPPFTPTPSRCRTPCSSGQSSPQRHSSGQTSPVWDRSHGTRTPDGATGGNSSDSTREKVPRYKRPSHIKAEYKRRGKIQVNAHLHNCERYTTSPSG